MKKEIQTQLLGRKVIINTGLGLHKWLEHEGKPASIESVHLADGLPYYTLSLANGELIGAYDWAFKLAPTE